MAAYWEIAAHLAYDMFSKCGYLIVIFFSLSFWNGNFFLIAPFPDHCLFVPSYSQHLLLHIIFIIIFFFKHLDIFIYVFLFCLSVAREFYYMYFKFISKWPISFKVVTNRNSKLAL